MSVLRRYEFLLPSQFNDGRPVPQELIADTLVSLGRVEIGPKNIASQYLGHAEISVASPSSAIACSDLRSSLAHSRASALLSMRLIFSDTAS